MIAAMKYVYNVIDVLCDINANYRHMGGKELCLNLN